MVDWSIGQLAKSAWDIASGSYLHREVKFTPADPTVEWQYIQHIIETAGTTRYSDVDGNSAVFACLRALAYAGIEAPLLAVQKIDGDQQPFEGAGLQQFVDEPNPELDMEELRWWSYYARHLDGNAYLVKVRSGSEIAGNVVELWPASPTRMEPVTERGSRKLIDFYKYKDTSGGGDIRIPTENVIHFKLGVDPRDPRKGCSPLKHLLREIATDSEATRFSDALLANFGIPGVVIKLPVEASLSPQQISDLKEGTRREFSSGQRGKVGVLTGGADMAQFGFSPEQLNLKALHDFPETRIAAVMGVDPLVARLGVGLEQTSNYASARQVRENFTELTVVPMWKMDGKKWTRKLARDFTQDRSVSIVHDLSEVRALQEDENDRHTRYRENFKAGAISREEFRTVIGFDPEIPAGDVIYTPSTVTYVESGKELTDPEAVRQQQADAAAARVQLNGANSGSSNGTDSANSANSAANRAKALDGLDGFEEVIQAIVDKSAPEFAKDLQRLQDQQEKRVTRALAG